MCYRTVCNQTSLDTTANGVADYEVEKQSAVRRQTLERDSSGASQDQATFPDQSSYLRCGWDDEVVPT